MKIGLVTPYIFPLPGGVNAHVGYLYENLVKRGHDVRIISSTHGPQRSSEGDIIRLGYGWSVAIVADPELGRPAFERWVASPDPTIRWIVRENLGKARLARMDTDWVRSLRARIER